MKRKICCIVYTILNSEIKFLVLHKNNWWNGWELVRGDLTNNEDYNYGIIREVNLVTGLNIDNINNFHFNYSYDYLKELNRVNANVSCFVAKSDDLMVTLDKEHDYYKWISFNSAMKLIDFDEQKKMLELFYNKFRTI